MRTGSDSLTRDMSWAAWSMRSGRRCERPRRLQTTHGAARLGEPFPEPRTRPQMPSAAERLIVALDMPQADDALALVDALGDDVSFYKVGWVRLLDGGLQIVSHLTERGKRVFVDLKGFDITETVRAAVKQIRDRGATFVTVHGNSACVRGAKEAAGDDLKVLAVTMLTSLSRADVYDVYGIDEDLSDVAVQMARFLMDKGCDGVISSPQEAARLRRELSPEFLIVTPGIRPDGSSENDHKRAGTPRQAISDGADYLVVGRPIYTAADPRAAARGIIEGISLGLRDRES